MTSEFFWKALLQASKEFETKFYLQMPLGQNNFMTQKHTLDPVAINRHKYVNFHCTRYFICTLSNTKYCRTKFIHRKAYDKFRA